MFLEDFLDLISRGFLGNLDPGVATGAFEVRYVLSRLPLMQGLHFLMVSCLRTASFC